MDHSTHESRDKDSPGRGYAIIIYGLYMGSVIALVTAPLGALIAWLRLGRGANWIDSHLTYQLRTFLFGLAALGVGYLVWLLMGTSNAKPMLAWTFGYLYLTAVLIWTLGRCGVGIYRITANQPIDKPLGIGFGGAKLTFSD